MTSYGKIKTFSGNPSPPKSRTPDCRKQSFLWVATRAVFCPINPQSLKLQICCCFLTHLLCNVK